MPQQDESNLGKAIPYLSAIFIIICGALLTLRTWFSDSFGLPFNSILFLDSGEWTSFVAALNEENWQIYFKVYLAIDCLFISCYLFIFTYFIRSFNSTAKFVLYGLLGILICTDLYENLNLFLLENMPFVSALKFVLFFILASFAINSIFKNYMAQFRTILFTLWHCRFTVFGLIFMFILINIPQGKDLVLYTFESEQRLTQLFILNVFICLSGIVFWYMPRFLFPENLQEDSDDILKIWRYKYWNNHFRSSSFIEELPVDEEEKSAHPILQRYQAKSSEEINLILSQYLDQKTYENLKDKTKNTYDVSLIKASDTLIYIRTYVPLFLSLIFYSMFIIYFLNISNQLENELKYFSKMGFVVKSFLFCLFVILAVFKKLRNRALNEFRKIIRSKYFDYSPSIVGLISLICIYLYNDNFKLLVYSEIGLLIAFVLFNLAIAHCSTHREFYKKNNKNVHVILICMLFLASLFFIVYLLAFTLKFSLGLSIGLVAILFYYSIYLIFSNKSLSQEKRTYYLTTLLLITIVSFVVSTSMDNNLFDAQTTDIDTNNLQENNNNLDKQIALFKSQFTEKRTDSIPVYFIASNGGGTMQAYWTAAVIAHIRAQTGDKIKQHIFASSGASGGSVGLGISTLAWDSDAKEVSDKIDAIYDEDFLSGGIAYLMGSDTWLSPFPFNLSGFRNRNKWLYEKYKIALDSSFEGSLWNKDFRHIWKNNAEFIPLYYANATRVEDGERAFSGSTSLQKVSSGLDVIDSLYRLNKQMSFGEAVLLTNRFPYVNSSAKIDRLGHFVDGGYHDNSGIETILEIIPIVQAELIKDTVNNFKIHVIHLNFGKEAYDEYNSDRPSNKNQLTLLEQNEVLVPIMTVYNSVLNGSVINRVQSLEQSGTTVHRLYLPDAARFLDKDHLDYDKKLLDDFNNQNIYLNLVFIPLGRTISKNQKEYVRTILNSKKLAINRELDKIIKAVQTN